MESGFSIFPKLQCGGEGKQMSKTGGEKSKTGGEKLKGGGGEGGGGEKFIERRRLRGRRKQGKILEDIRRRGLKGRRESFRYCGCFSLKAFLVESFQFCFTFMRRKMRERILWFSETNYHPGTFFFRVLRFLNNHGVVVEEEERITGWWTT